jgi:predicted GNAT family acetyltransferase
MEETMNNVEVRNNKTEYRYELWMNGELAGYTQYVMDRGRIAFLHTEVYDSYEGMGLGSRLARAALEDVRTRGADGNAVLSVHRGFHRAPSR